MEGQRNELFEAVILDHNESPRCYGPLPDCTHRADAYNPICGDRFSVLLRVEGNTIAASSFEGHGCAVSKASFSIMTEQIHGRSIAESIALGRRFRNALRGETRPSNDLEDNFGAAEPLPAELTALLIVRNAPSRVRCALLGWDALTRALQTQ